jgi:cytosine/adenosine deaminase-related metal-dependent hydrolase
MSEVNVGDRVEIVVYRSYDGEFNGRIGVVTDVDDLDDGIPFRVRLDDTDDERVWAAEVRLVTPASTADREALVTRARALLAGTDHTGADVVAMAAFLAGE